MRVGRGGGDAGVMATVWRTGGREGTRCMACGPVFAVMDLVTRKWITELVSAEETSTQVQVVFLDALEAEGLLELVEARQDQPDPDPLSLDAAVDVLPPILLAVSDNGPQMTSGSTREFMAMCTIALQFGRPGTPTDQAWSRASSPISKPTGRT